MFIRYVKHGEPLTSFVSIEEPEAVDADGIFTMIQNALISLKPTNADISDEEYSKNLYEKMLSVNFDGASVMPDIKSVQKKFKDFVPGLVYTHCVAYRTELAIMHFLKFDDSYLEKFDDILNGIFRFYYVSPVRRKELRKIRDMFENEFRQLFLFKNIRWVASRVRALNTIETYYEVLVFDLESKSYGTDETSKKALGYLQFIKQPKRLFYLHFFPRYGKHH